MSHRHQRSWLALLAAAAAALAALPAGAQLARVELHALGSLTLSDRQLLTGRGDGEPVTLAADLRLPHSAGRALPAVVLLHGSGGISGYVDDWAVELNRAGFATLLVDSFTGRGITDTVSDQGRLGRLAMIVDAYRALRLLRSHPQIDPARIALLGFSRGGQSALYASLRRFHRAYGPGPGDGFAAFLAFYPPCNTVYRGDEEVVAAPIRVFHGTADDFNAIGPCRDYVGRLRAAGADARLHEYAGAAHVFDWPLLRQPLRLAQAQVTRGCALEEDAAGVVVARGTGRPFDYDDPCVGRGATLRYDEAAHRAARRDVLAALAQAFADG